MNNIVKELLKKETMLVEKERATGKFVIRPSSVVAGVTSVLYLLSSLDIVPEALIRPKAFGFIDDLVLLVASGILIYSDLGGISNAGIQTTRFREEERDIREDVVPVTVEPVRDDDIILSSSDSDGVPNSLESLLRSTSISSDNDTGDLTTIDLSINDEETRDTGSQIPADIYAGFFSKDKTTTAE